MPKRQRDGTISRVEPKVFGSRNIYSTTLEVSNSDNTIFSDQIMRDNFFNRVLEDDKIFLWGLEEMTGKIRMYESYQ